MANDVEAQLRDMRRRFRYALVGYAVLALGVIVALVILDGEIDSNREQNDRLETQAQNLALAAGAYCVAGLAPDAGENVVIHRLALGKPIRFPHDCRLIIERIERASD